jgi:hypothetical protein
VQVSERSGRVGALDDFGQYNAGQFQYATVIGLLRFMISRSQLHTVLLHLTARLTPVTNKIAVMSMTPFDADLRPEHLTSQNVFVVKHIRIVLLYGIDQG